MGDAKGAADGCSPSFMSFAVRPLKTKPNPIESSNSPPATRKSCNVIILPLMGCHRFSIHAQSLPAHPALPRLHLSAEYSPPVSATQARIAARSGLAVGRGLASMLEMSRRSRRRHGTAGRQPWLGKAALGLIVAGVVGAAILYATVRGYLYSDAFRQFLSVKTSEAVGVDGEFTPFRWDGLAVDTDAFEAAGNGIIRNLRVDGLHTEVSVGGLRRGVWEIRSSRLQRLEISLNATKHDAVAPIKKPAPPAARQSGWLPREIEVQGIDVQRW